MLRKTANWLFFLSIVVAALTVVELEMEHSFLNGVVQHQGMQDEKLSVAGNLTGSEIQNSKWNFLGIKSLPFVYKTNSQSNSSLIQMSEQSHYMKDGSFHNEDYTLFYSVMRPICWRTYLLDTGILNQDHLDKLTVILMKEFDVDVTKNHNIRFLKKDDILTYTSKWEEKYPDKKFLMNFSYRSYDIYFRFCISIITCFQLFCLVKYYNLEVELLRGFGSTVRPNL